MADILLTGKAISDVKNIYDYIIEDSLQNAEMLKADILQSINHLGLFPQMGISLSVKLHMKTDYRYIVSGKFLIFYKTDNVTVWIFRVLSSEMDYVSILFK